MKALVVSELVDCYRELPCTAVSIHTSSESLEYRCREFRCTVMSRGHMPQSLSKVWYVFIPWRETVACVPSHISGGGMARDDQDTERSVVEK